MSINGHPLRNFKLYFLSIMLLYLQGLELVKYLLFLLDSLILFDLSGDAFFLISDAEQVVEGLFLLLSSINIGRDLKG
jgi:hypothetical protein